MALSYPCPCPQHEPCDNKNVNKPKHSLKSLTKHTNSIQDMILEVHPGAAQVSKEKCTLKFIKKKMGMDLGSKRKWEEFSSLLAALRKVAKD
ncbi:hypothetical protein U0070_007468 [Myodes glareolus]|uniref:Large ribosomal subunit protein eL36 n=1 Tax=Myodes glareolus TaxID=447135 RepID=A0AAW0I7F4_MYOGA